MSDNIRTNHCAACKEMADANQELRSEIVRLRDGLGDALHALTLITERDGLLDDEMDLEAKARAALAGKGKA